MANKGNDQEPSRRELFGKNAVIAITVVCATAVVIVELLTHVDKDTLWWTLMISGGLLVAEVSILD
jgi:hypothetical protein